VPAVDFVTRTPLPRPDTHNLPLFLSIPRPTNSPATKDLRRSFHLTIKDLSRSFPQTIDDEDVFVRDFADTRSNRVLGSKRGFGELEDDGDDIFGNKANLKVEETAPGETTGMIIKVRESLRKWEEDIKSTRWNSRLLSLRFRNGTLHLRMSHLYLVVRIRRSEINKLSGGGKGVGLKNDHKDVKDDKQKH
ncbi:hypothetical protein Drorol1_Dr00004321, partial [Drosera rotundifolia]